MADILSIEQVRRMADETVTIMRSRIVTAVRYCEAYEGTDRTMVLNGSALSPSTRALPGAERVFQASYSNPDLWETFEQITNDVESINVADGRTDEPYPDAWTVAWDDGCLWAYAPEYREEV